MGKSRSAGTPRFTDIAPFMKRRTDVLESCVLCGATHRTFAMKTIRTNDGLRHICRGKH